MSVEDVDRRAKYAVIPKSVNETKVVKLQLKELKTQKEVRTVLPEEKYVSGLEKIIVRDYFPELPILKAKQDYMDAVARNDVAKMRELQLRYSTNRRTERRTSPLAGTRKATSPIKRGVDDETPNIFDPETPGPAETVRPGSPAWNEEEGDNEAELARQKAKKRKKEQLSVDGYLNTFTSEDNASFEELTDLMDQREKVQNAWIYRNAERHNKELIYRAPDMLMAADAQLALRDAPEYAKVKPIELDNWNYTARNSVLFHPAGAELTQQEMIERAAKNQREINKVATRFPGDLKNKPSGASMARAAFMQAQVQAGKIDVTGKELGLSDAALGILATPTVVPGVDDSPLMTWGEIDGTPFRLDGSDIEPQMSNAPTFKIPEIPMRDHVARNITDTIAQRYRDKRQNAIKNAEAVHKSPGFGSSRYSDKLARMSPAARALVTNKLGIRLGTASPSPSTTPETPYTPNSFKSPMSTLVRRTPGMARKSTPSAVGSITDNLLNISTPKAPPPSTKESPGPSPTPQQPSTSSSGRAKASDYF
ncbi:unnamed protein product, partial [Mesorhabditis spiculigera]